MKKKNQYPVPLTIERQFVGGGSTVNETSGYISERIVKSSSGNGQFYFRNIFEIEIWIDEFAEVRFGDYVIYGIRWLMIQGFMPIDFNRKILIEAVTVDDFTKFNENAKKIALFNAVNNDLVTFLETDSVINEDYLFVCLFFDNDGNPVKWIDYQRVDSNHVKLIIEEGMTFSGYILISRR